MTASTLHPDHRPSRPLDHRLSVAPMMDWTDRHCRFLHRLLAPQAVLYTEMITAAAIIHGNRERLLAGTDNKHTVLQLGGSDPDLLAEAVRLAAPYDYAEYNFNVGCPSDRVQSGRFGACLMAEPELVAQCTQAMMGASGGKPVTVKCRIGIDDMESVAGLNHFIATVANSGANSGTNSGVKHFIIHARYAWLKGLSPKQNRMIPPLDYERVLRLANDFPDLTFTINGGISTVADAVHFADIFSPNSGGVMVGRAAYQRPFSLAQMAAAVYGHRPADRFEVAYAMADYALAETAPQAMAEGTPLIAITRPMLGLMAGLPGARGWRQMLSEYARSKNATPDLIRQATDKIIDTAHRYDKGCVYANPQPTTEAA